MGPISKFFNQPSDGNGSPLFWSGLDDFPYRGSPPTMIRSEEREQVPIVYDAKVAIFSLPGDEVRYQEIIDKCANGWYVLRHEIVKYDEAAGKWHIFLQWLERYNQIPDAKSNRDAVKSVTANADNYTYRQ